MSNAHLLAKYGKPGPRYTSYPTADRFAALKPSVYIEHLKEASKSDEPLSVYLHLPFCESRCLFCACNVIISPDQMKVVDYLDFLRSEIDMVAEALGDRRKVSQLHIGGGTPTYFPAERLSGVVDHLLSYFELTEDAEVSVEIDPRVTTPEHLKMLAKRGFNRISLGVQDLDLEVQAAIGRLQSWERTKSLLDLARSLGMRHTNVDLIYGLPHQTVESYTQTIKQVIALKPGRLAVYGFAYVPWMKGHQKKMDQSTLPDPALRLELRDCARDLLVEAGYVEIGMDHYALADDPLSVAQKNGTLGRNFMGYTITRAPDMIGLGISSIGYVAGAYFQNVRKLSEYRSLVGQGEYCVDKGFVLSDDDLRRAEVIEELMCNFRVSKEAFEAHFNVPFDVYFQELGAKFDELSEDGLIEENDTELRVTKSGQTLIRAVARVFDAYLPDITPEKKFSAAV